MASTRRWLPVGTSDPRSGSPNSEEEPKEKTRRYRAGSSRYERCGAEAPHLTVVLHHAHAGVGVTVAATCGSLFRLLRNERLGGHDERRDGGCVLQRGTGYLRRINDPGLHQVTVLTGRGIEALGSAQLAYPLNHNTTFVARVHCDLAQRGFERLLNEHPARLHVFGTTTLLINSFLSTKQCHTAAGDDALFHSSLGRLDGVLDAMLLLFELDLGRRADLDDGNAT